MQPVIISFYAWRTANVREILGDGFDVFVDSGAFSAYTVGARIDLAEYARFLNENATVINFAAGLDVIGDHVQTARNYERLRHMTSVRLVPTFHTGSPWPVLEQMATVHDFIALGGAVTVQKRTRAMLTWAVKAHQILAANGAVAHGFGLTRDVFARDLPWYSIDSSYWFSADRTGTLAMWDPQARHFVRVRVGTPAVHKHAALLRYWGMVPERAALPGYARMAIRGREEGTIDLNMMHAASVGSWVAYERYLQGRFTVPAPAGVTGDGPKVYLCAGGRGHVRILAAVGDRGN